MKALHFSFVSFLVSLFSIGVLQAQDGDNYSAYWRTIDSLEGVGQPKTALEKTEALYKKIKQDNSNVKQNAQLIKTIIYLNKYQAQLEEDGLAKAIGRFEKEIAVASEPVKSILQSMTAEMYDKYLLSNLSKIAYRTKLEPTTKSEDISMWTVDQLLNTSAELYCASLKAEVLKQTKTDTTYENLIYFDKSGRDLRPTLYDVLAERALNYLMNERSYLIQTSDLFYIDNPDALKDINTFINTKFETQYEQSMKYQTLQIFQQILHHHSNSGYAKALANYNLKRIKYVYNTSIIPNKDELYLDILVQMGKTFADRPFGTEVAYELALYHHEKGSNYQPALKEMNRWAWKKAYEICQKAINRFPKSHGAGLCKRLQVNIHKKNLGIQLQKYNGRNIPVLASLSYRNVSKGHCRLYKVSKEQLNIFYDKSGNEQLEYLQRLKLIQSWTTQLKSDGDFRNHNTEIALEGQDYGIYLLAISEHENFSYSSNGVAFAHYYHTNISYTYRKADDKYEFYLTDRISGLPLEGVEVEFYENRYNSLFRKYRRIKIARGITDAQGKVSSAEYVKLNNQNYHNRTYFIKFSYERDVLETDESYYNRAARSNKIKRKTTHLFLDRAIYRPGQTIHFKGLAVYSEGKKEHEIVKNQEIDVIFRNASYEEITRQRLKTNQYGTFHGVFIAPSNGLTGRMYISSSFGAKYKSFRVEEYKRPKFELQFTPVKGSFQLEDKVVVKGNAKAYAGNDIDGAKVTYRVVRQARFPYWAWWKWGAYNPYGNRAAQEIKFGETTTNAHGAFEISFTARADKSIPKDQSPEFNYTVYVDVTDITGETHSAQTSVRVGYIALSAGINVPNIVNKSEAEAFKIRTQNLSGTFEPAIGTILVEALETPSTVFVNRPWKKPDQYTLSEARFKKNFPNYAYKEEDKMQNWKVIKKVQENSFDTKEAKEFKLDKISSLPQGAYKLSLKTKDKFGNEIEVVKYFTLVDDKAKTPPLNEALFLANSSLTAEPNELVTIDFGSAYEDAKVLYEVEHEAQIIESKWLEAGGRQKVSFSVEEKHRGNVFLHLNMTKNNRNYQKTVTVKVPWTNKQLQVEYSTFRDKLYPGQDEEWKIKISGQNKDKVAAELLATMYDASLDALAQNNWTFDIYRTNSPSRALSGSYSFVTKQASLSYDLNGDWWDKNIPNVFRTLPEINWFDFFLYEMGPFVDLQNERGIVSDEIIFRSDSETFQENKTIIRLELPKTSVGKKAPTDWGDVKIRTNLNETVFFFPNLMTDQEGNVILKFKMNEALTRWKFMAFGHTQDLKSVVTTKEVVTQKDLMILPNAPRFFRQNDVLYFTAKVSNLTNKDMKGQASLQLLDALTRQPIDAAFANTDKVSNFEAKGKQSTLVSWKIKIPDDWTTAVTYRVLAQAGNFSDGEENTLPVLSNRMLVTETLPLPVGRKEKKTVDFSRMAEVSKSKTMAHHKMTLEFTPNPIWYAVQSLPYLMEYPHECTEQIFSRYYANSLSTTLVNRYPKIKRVFKQWKEADREALKSNLSKNPELKYILLEETPWVLAAQSEEQQKANLGILFDLNRMTSELERAQDKMAERQLANGGFAWFTGGRDNWYITQYIVEGMGRLNALGIKNVQEDAKMKELLTRSISYIDNRFSKSYRNLLKAAKKSGNEKKYLQKNHLSSLMVHYMYARSFFPNQKIQSETVREALTYYEGQAKKHWLSQSEYMQGMLALALHRSGKDKKTPQAIVKSLKKRALNSEEMGMYWKYPSGYYWYQLPIETHALMIEVFKEVASDDEAVNDLKTWLLKAKQTTHWKTTKATAAACYALLGTSQGELTENQEVEITLGNQKLDLSKIKKEAGTGYFKATWNGDEIKNDMTKITANNPNNNVTWGAVYWQYFEDYDQITDFKETPLQLNKQLFKQVNTAEGPVLRSIKEATLKPGDLIKVRIELKVDRDVEYVHMKDTRSSGFEPVNALSEYKYQDGLGYYESTRDASTHFFFSYLPKGSYVFEYPVRINHKGDFSNGITTIQCMYAPEFTAHSEGVRVEVK